MTRELLGRTKNDHDVYLDTERSHALTHFAKNPKLKECVRRALPDMEATEGVVRMHFDAGETVGKTDLVETDDRDEIVYAMRPLRTQYSRFVKNRQSQDTSWITVDLRKSKEGEYYLHTSFIGKLTPSFPGGDFLPEQSREFWSSHALVWGGQETIPGSETSECPW